jgi:hypothetical protein
MGIKVDWHNIKKTSPTRRLSLHSPCMLWEFVKQLAIEHKAFPESLGDPYNFRELIKPGKPIGDRIQEIHPKIVVLSWVIEGSTKFMNDYPAYVQEMYCQG